MSTNLEQIANYVAELEEDRLLETVENALNSQVDPLAILEKCREGITLVGERFAAGEYFVVDLIVSAEIFNRVLELVTPNLQKGQADKAGTVVIGTAKGDIHDIGKNIVIGMLKCNGFEVIDLGVDVDPDTFVNCVKESGARVVGISALLTVAFPSIQTTIQRFVQAGLRNSVKIIVGGAPVNEAVCEMVGADAYGKDAIEAVSMAKRFCGNAATAS